jgi:hypothetical protein
VRTPGWKNVDKRIRTAQVSGKALNGTQPLPYAEVIIYGENYNSYTYTVADQNGQWSIQYPSDPSKQFKLRFNYEQYTL